MPTRNSASELRVLRRLLVIRAQRGDTDSIVTRTIRERVARIEAERGKHLR